MSRPRVVVDFETYYDADLSVLTLGLRNYVRQADAYIISVVGEDLRWCGTLPELEQRYPALIQDINLGRVEAWAANANFDHSFWQKHYGAPCTVPPWQCLLDLAGFHQLPRDLGNVTRVALGRKLDKDVRATMKGVRFESLPPAERERVIQYGLDDSVAGWELLQKLAPMSPVEAELAEHTRLINRRGLHVNAEKVRRDIGLLEDLRFESLKKIPWVSEGEAPLSYPQFAAYCERHGVGAPASLDKRDLKCAAWMQANPELAQVVLAMRGFRGVNTKTEKLKSVLAATDDNGIMQLDFIYCGARHTRRWSSRNINVQNLDAKRVFAAEMAELQYFRDNPEEDPGIFMREYFIPPPGCKFGILDFSQIEPRVLNWIVGNLEMLSAIRAGFGIYEAHAKASMKWGGSAGTLKHTNPDLYKFAKERVLSLGYGMGPDRFRDRAKTNLGMDLTDAQAKAAVEDFRRSNPRIIALWRKFQDLIRNAAYETDKTIELEMPTGDLLQHFHVRGKGRGQGFESFTIRGDFGQASHIPNLFGGLLTENITQRIARDVLAESILRLEKNGIPVAFHAHDEAILILDESSAKEDFEEAKRIMAVPPDWCADLPVEVAGEIHAHYTKLQ